jgi:hypothetical protein
MTIAMAKMLLKAFKKGGIQGGRFYKPIVEVAKQHNTHPGVVVAWAKKRISLSKDLRLKKSLRRNGIYF